MFIIYLVAVLLTAGKKADDAESESPDVHEMDSK